MILKSAISLGHTNYKKIHTVKTYSANIGTQLLAGFSHVIEVQLIL